MWIGAHDTIAEGEMIWVSDNTLVSSGFTDWSPGQPDNYKNREDCILFSANRGYQWNDVGCSSKQAYICKK